MRIRIRNPNSFGSWKLGSRMENSDPGSGINTPDPPHCLFVRDKHWRYALNFGIQCADAWIFISFDS
jgi:hypothetical protein